MPARRRIPRVPQFVDQVPAAAHGLGGPGRGARFRFLPLRGGRVLLACRDLDTWGRRELARTVAYVPQAQAAPFPFTVAEVLLMGRTPRLGVAGSPGRNDVLVSHSDHAFAVATTAALLHHETLQVGRPVDVVTAENLAVACGAEIEILRGTVADGAAVTACVPLL